MIDQQSNEDFSVFYYMKSLFDPLGVKVVDEFPLSSLVIPSVAVETEEITGIGWEMGNTHRVYSRVYFVNVFATNKTQRQQMGYTILRSLETSIPVYDYNTGFPPDAIPTQIGCLQVLDKTTYRKILIDPELVSKLYYRGVITFETYFNKL
jgi:hypothetical protein